MEICQAKHDEVCFEEEVCPVCSMREDKDSAVYYQKDKTKHAAELVRSIFKCISPENHSISLELYTLYLDYISNTFLSYEYADRIDSHNAHISRKDKILSLIDWYSNALFDDPEYIVDLQYLGDV